MFKAFIVTVSMLVASTAGHLVGQVGHTPAPAHISHAGDYALHAASERTDEAAGVVIPDPPAPTIPDIIRGAFTPLGQDSVNWAEKIAFCESTYNPNAVNPATNAQGLFQFLPSTWAGTPYASQSPFDPVANAKAAAWLLQTYGASQWECQA